jgi:hypothetical protein
MSEPSEDPGERARKYIATMEKVLRQHQPLREGARVEDASIAKVTDAIHRYLQDAHFYVSSGKATTALASIAYAEGLLDALIFLNLTQNTEGEAK